jgi:hypothetical protein
MGSWESSREEGFERPSLFPLFLLFSFFFSPRFLSLCSLIPFFPAFIPVFSHHLCNSSCEKFGRRFFLKKR